MTKVIIVTGCDSAHYELVIDLFASLKAAGHDGLALGFVHVGDDVVPPAVETAVDHVAHVGDDAFLIDQLRGFRLAYLKIKSRLPALFPGYDIYVWLDGDTWVQNRVGLDQIVQCAQLADFCAHPELDPSYFRQMIPSDRLLFTYAALYGQADAEQHVRLPMFNSGVFAARASSPLWSRWHDAMAEVAGPMAETPELYFSDQVPLHRLIATGRLTAYPLKSVNNWLVHAALPTIDWKRRRLTTTHYPYEPLNIVHLTWVTKDSQYQIAGSDRQTTFRYRDIEALLRPSGDPPRAGRP